MGRSPSFTPWRPPSPPDGLRPIRDRRMLAPRDARARVTSTAQDQEAGLAIQLARERPFRLGAVEVRPATREVVGPDGREVLEPRVMQVLVALARAGGETVTREDLTESCWEGRIVG